MTKLIDVDPEVMRKDFGRDSFAMRHYLVDHPLLQIDRLAQLANSLPADQYEHTDSNAPDILPGGGQQDNRLSAGDVVRGIETNGKWMVLKRVHTDPDYGALTEEILSEVDSERVDSEGGRIMGECYVILSSPNSNVPSHFDPEYNMLFQIQGTKQVTVGKFKDVETERTEAERYYGGGHRNISDVPFDAKIYQMGPGDGVHIPAAGAARRHQRSQLLHLALDHVLHQGNSSQVVDVYAVNARLRRLGISPKPPGERQRPAQGRRLARHAQGSQRGPQRRREPELAARSVGSPRRAQARDAPERGADLRMRRITARAPARARSRRRRTGGPGGASGTRIKVWTARASVAKRCL